MSRAVAATVAAASLYSRFASFVLLVVSARILTVQEFGALAVAVSVAIALANTFASGAGDQLAAQARTNPTAARTYFLVSSIILLSVIGAATSVGFVAGTTVGSVVASGASVCAGTTICMNAMNCLRGSGHVTTGALVAYAVLPTLRAAAIAALIPVSAATLQDAMMAINLATAVAAVIAFTLALALTRTCQNASARERGSARPVAIYIGTAIAVGWMVVGHGDVTALAAMKGTVEAGEYTPTMRIMEALTALGIGIKFAGTREILADPHAGLRASHWTPLLLTYSAGVAVCLMVAPTLVPLAFGNQYHFDLVIALILAPAYLLSCLISILLQILIARGSGVQVATLTAKTVALALAALATGSACAGGLGVAVANFVVLLTWFAGLCRLEKQGRSADVYVGKEP